MRWNVVSLADARAQRWRNGGGTTRELLALPTAEDWRLRVSVAEVESDGPFSAFPGVNRWFAVLGGAGVRLRIDGVEHMVERASAPLQFDGGAGVDCALVDGATQDLNLMTRDRAARMQRVTGVNEFKLAARTLIAVFANAAASVSVDGEQFEIDAAHLAWRTVDEGASIKVRSSDALWMEIAP